MIERLPKLDNAAAAAAEWHGCDDVADLEVTQTDLPRLMPGQPDDVTINVAAGPERSRQTVDNVSRILLDLVELPDAADDRPRLTLVVMEVQTEGGEP